MFVCSSMKVIFAMCVLLAALAVSKSCADLTVYGQTRLDSPWDDWYGYIWPDDNPITWESRHTVGFVNAIPGKFYYVNLRMAHLLDNDTFYNVGFPDIPYDQPMEVLADMGGSGEYTWPLHCSRVLGVGMYTAQAWTHLWTSGPTDAADPKPNDSGYSSSPLHYFGVDYFW
jgi:hypothetical protein